MSKNGWKRALLLCAIGFGLVVIAVINWRRSRLTESQDGSAVSTRAPGERLNGPGSSSISTVGQPAGGSDLAAPRQLPGGRYEPKDPRWAERRRLRKEDPQYEWKTPISFYGKVVDEAGRPVAGATAELLWTDMSPEGSSKTNLFSGADGQFSITGIRGKHLGIDIFKEGYYRALSKGRSSFEYAGFWEPTYHQPDPDNPVVFHLRKKGEAEPLAVGEGKVLVGVGKGAVIPWPGDSGVVRVAVTENDKASRKWAAQLSVDGGGVLPALEEFPFLAPESGYQPSILIDQDSPKPPGWQGQHGGRFYVKTGAAYALLEIQQLLTKKTMYYEVRLNPSGSRNLEFDPKKIANDPRPAQRRKSGPLLPPK